MNKNQILILCLAVAAVAVASIYFTTSAGQSNEPVLPSEPVTNATSSEPSADVLVPNTKGPGDKSDPPPPLTTYPEAAKAAREQLSDDVNIAESRIDILTVYKKQWGNACLDTPRKDEACAEVITPGYEVTMRAAGTTYVYRTNESGSEVRSHTVLGA